MIQNILLVSLGGMLGALGRYGVYTLLPPSSFPWATFLVNMLGCFLAGLALGLSHSENWELLTVVGFLGAFTTFSAFSMENIRLINEGQWVLATIHIFVQVLGGLVLVALGLKISHLNG